MKICLPIRGDIDGALSLIGRGNENEDISLFEFWVDGFSMEEVEKLFKASEKPVLVVNKGNVEQGSFSGTEEERVEKLIDCVRFEPRYLDIGIGTDADLIKRLIENRGEAGVILSFHDFEGTPSIDVLKETLNEMESFSVDVLKFATQVNSTHDVQTLFCLINVLREAERKFIVTGMGNEGKLIRIGAPLLGAEFTFAPLEESSSSASGQICARDLKAIWDILA